MERGEWVDALANLNRSQYTLARILLERLGKVPESDYETTCEIRAQVIDRGHASEGWNEIHVEIEAMTPVIINELEAGSAEDVLRWALERFHPRIGFASSFGAEDVVVIDMLARIRQDARIFTLDTGRLHEETYEAMERIRRRYGLVIETHFPQ